MRVIGCKLLHHWLSAMRLLSTLSDSYYCVWWPQMCSISFRKIFTSQLV
eukprot:COSAG01_NODE_31078_length_604_cov_0.928713_1_plen_48_part_10